ncbi:MAG: citryl-CoA lyase [Anaerolineales bacterium]|nr:citryl-CoA lyase [Anaerolineales bacterium]
MPTQKQDRKLRNVGKYYESGDWSDYWRTAVSFVEPHKVLIRGYPIEEICKHLTYAEMCWLTIRGELPSPAQARVMDALLCCMPDHQFVAAHTPAARFTASAFPESPIPGIASAVLTMGSNTVSPQESARLILATVERMAAEDLSAADAARRMVQEYLEAGRRLPGLGHPTHKREDMRASALRSVTVAAGLWGDKCQVYEAIHDAFCELTGKQLPINIDGMMAAVMTQLGFDPLEMAGIGALAVLPGVIAHVVEEIREGVPLRVIPDALGSVYVGEPERHLPQTGQDTQ